MAQHLVVVCGYGCHLTPGVEKYLDKVIDFCNRQQADAIIFSGGYTNRATAPRRSEAKTMKAYLLPRLTYSPQFIFLEEDSYMTPENIKNSAEIIKQEGLLSPEGAFTVFCEVSRGIIVDIFSRRYIGQKPNIETASWNIDPPGFQILGLMYVWTVSRLPFLGYILRTARIRKSKHR
jgi:hypothetical protein